MVEIPGQYYSVLCQKKKKEKKMRGRELLWAEKKPKEKEKEEESKLPSFIRWPITPGIN